MGLELFLVCCLTGTFLIHGLFLFFYIRRLAILLPRPNIETYRFDKPEKLAVIIAARNEDQSISRLLNALLNQSYPGYTIEIVDDYSTDNTAAIVKEFTDKYNFIHYHHNAFAQGKKHALRYAIETVNSSLLLFTDADCVPASDNWISSMVNSLADKDISLAYGKYREERGFLNKFIQFETGMIAAQYMAFAVRRRPYMGVGRNLMYRRDLFMGSDRFESHNEMRSGDDDLFISQWADGNNTTVNLRQDSFTISDPPQTFLQLFRQKRRHLTTSVKYPFPIQLRLSAISLSNMYFYLFALAICAFLPALSLQILAIFILKIALDMVFYQKVFRQLQISHIFYLFPLLDIALSLYYFILAPFLIFRKTDTW